MGGGKGNYDFSLGATIFLAKSVYIKKIYLIINYLYRLKMVQIGIV